MRRASVFFKTGHSACTLNWRPRPTSGASAAPDFEVTAHTGQVAITQRCIIDEHGRVYLETALGFGLVHTQDMLHASDAIERGLWVPQEVMARDLQTRFGYVRSPQGANETLLKK